MMQAQARRKGKSGLMIGVLLSLFLAGAAVYWVMQASGLQTAGNTSLPTTEPGITGVVTDISDGSAAAAGDPAGGAGDPNAPVSATADPNPPAAKPNGSGKCPSEQKVCMLLVEEKPNEAAGSNKASVRLDLTEGARLLKQQGGKVVEADLQSLSTGQKVRVWFTGPVAESYPVQATADVVLILE